jgi:UPF0042 nucleotide-binding protein
MPQLLVSFGYKNGLPLAGDDENGGIFAIIDVRTLLNRNPYHKKGLRKKRGTDEDVQADIQLTPNFLESMRTLTSMIEHSTSKVCYIGCTGGHHRSVYAAILIGKALGIPVRHRDINQ